MRYLAPILIALATSLGAQELTTDAFGILPSSALDDRQDWAGFRTTSGGRTETQPAEGPDAAVLFVGPKSIVAGKEPGHAVAIGLDRHGNMLDGVATDFVLGYGEAARADTRLGIADWLFTPPPVADTHLAGADIGGVQSARADYRITADLATVQPRFDPGPDGMMPETFTVLETAPLVDAFGNTVDDGVGMTLVLTDADGRRTLLPTVVRDGVGRSTVLSRAIEGQVTGSLALGGVGADGLRFAIAPQTVSDPGNVLIWAEPAIAAINLRIGPLATTSGFLVPDGTVATVAVTPTGGVSTTTQGWVLDGYLSFLLPLDPGAEAFNVTLSLGSERITRAVAVSPPPANSEIRGAE